MGTKLKNLKITKVDFVDEGANPDAHIKLFKSKELPEGAENVTPEPEIQGEDQKVVEKKGIAKKLSDFFMGLLAETEDPEEVEKGNSESFKEKLKERQISKIADEIWTVVYSLHDSLVSILYDEDLDFTQKEEAMKQSFNEFAELMPDAITAWTTGKPMAIIAKAIEAKTGSELEAIIAARDNLSSIIEKSTEGSEDNKTNMSKGEDAEMKIDKSKMTEAERAFLENIEKNYGVAEAEDNQHEVTPEGAAAPQTTPAAAPAPEAPAEDVTKGLTPELKAEMAELRKFKEDAEDRELHAVAKKYELIGKKEEDLFPILKSLKKADEKAYGEMISALDGAVEAVNKSGAFVEIGKSGNGSFESDSWKQAETKAAEIMKNKTGITKNQALQEVFDQDPELAKRCKEEA